MPGNLTFDELKAAASRQEIDTVVVVIVDMQGRLMGKRFHVANFIDSAYEETHCCNYLLATDMEMATPDGYASTSWAAGYGDYVMKPDLSTLRILPWLEKTAMVYCDLLDHHTHARVPHAPRSVLQHQLDRLDAMGLTAASATELEFFVFRESYEEAREKSYQDLTPISPYNEDYHIFQTAKEELLMRDIRNHLFAAGIPVENTKGEAEKGQAELNVRYSDALDMADNHSFCKHAIKEIALTHGRSVTFMAKTHEDLVGSSSHVHQSLWRKDGQSAFADDKGPHGMSTIMQQFLAGQLKYAADITFFLAPYVNSYKRFTEGTFAPTRIVWSIDNRTAGFRIVGEHSQAIRIECRIGGVDLNPYLAQAGLLAAGIAGIEEQLSLPEVFDGDAYAATGAQRVPSTLRAATDAFANSAMLKSALGAEVHAHYLRCAEVEQEDFDRVVTDYEVRRGFERA